MGLIDNIKETVRKVEGEQPENAAPVEPAAPVAPVENAEPVDVAAAPEAPVEEEQEDRSHFNCPECDGEGLDKNANIPGSQLCKRCNGSGHVEV